MDSRYLDNAKIFKAFCDEKRLMIIEMLQQGEKCACELLARFDIAQPTLSHHMKILVESGVVSARKEGKWMYYSISQEGSERAVNLLKEITAKMANDNETNKECCKWLKNLAAPKTATVVSKV